MTEETIVESIKENLKDLAMLMNEAREHNLSVSFDINRDVSRPTSKYKPSLVITKTVAEI